MIHYECPYCNKSLVSPVCDGGKEWDCPECKARFLLPDLSSSRQYKCVDCKSKIYVELGECSSCGTVNQLPILYQLMTGLGVVTGFIGMFLYHVWFSGSFLAYLGFFMSVGYMTTIWLVPRDHHIIGLSGKKIFQACLVAHLLLTIVFFSLPAYWSEITTATWVFAGLIPVLIFATVYGYARNGRVIACFSPLEPKIISDGINPDSKMLKHLEEMKRIEGIGINKPETHDDLHELNQTPEVHDEQDSLIVDSIVEADPVVEQPWGGYPSANRTARPDPDIAQRKAAHYAKKSDSVNLSDVLRANGCDYLYHFTDEANIDSIRRFGIFSRHHLLRREINHITGGDDTSLFLDQQKGLDRYVHLSLTDKHPMAYYAEKRSGHSRILHLRLAPEVIDMEEVSGTISVATSSDTQLEKIGEFLDNIDWEILSEYLTGCQVNMHKGSRFNMMCKAEILVPNYIPPSMIIDL